MNLGGVWRREKEKGGRGKGNIKRMKDSFMGWVGLGSETRLSFSPLD